MKDTRPWVQETDSDEIRALLRSADLDEPPSGAMRRVLTKAGVGVGVGLAVVATSTTTASAAKLGPAVVGKWLAISVFVGAGAVAAVQVARPSTTKLAQPALTSTAQEASPHAVPTPAATPALEPTDMIVPFEPSNIEAPAVATAPRATKAAPAASADISGEIAAISQARGALDKGNARGALAALDKYQQDYPRGALSPEATVLRIEALNVAGDRPRAKSLGDAFLKAHPKSPHAQRVRSLIGAATP
jgi:TolA-binding protein